MALTSISERHRHRYEVNNHFVAQLEEAGLIISGLSADNQLVEMIEIPDTPMVCGGCNSIRNLTLHHVTDIRYSRASWPPLINIRNSNWFNLIKAGPMSPAFVYAA